MVSWWKSPPHCCRYPAFPAAGLRPTGYQLDSSCRGYSQPPAAQAQRPAVLVRNSRGRRRNQRGSRRPRDLCHVHDLRDSKQYYCLWEFTTWSDFDIIWLLSSPYFLHKWEIEQHQDDRMFHFYRYTLYIQSSKWHVFIRILNFLKYVIVLFCNLKIILNKGNLNYLKKKIHNTELFLNYNFRVQKIEKFVFKKFMIYLSNDEGSIILRRNK